MSKYQELVMDIASYQPSDLTFFKEAVNKGVKAVIVKLTEGSENGDHYINPKAAEQISNAKAAGLLVHAYHYAKFNGVKDAQDEADWFTKNAKLLGITAESVMALDIEDSSNKYYATDDANAFIQRVKDRGYPNTDVYSMASWFWAGRLVPSQLIAKNLWVANYGVDSPGLDNVGLWQYTSSFVINGARVDMSYDFNGFYTKARPNVVPNPQTETEQSFKKVNVTYGMRPIGMSFLPPVTNAGSGDNGFAGLPTHSHDYLYIKVDHGTMKYRVKTNEDGWLPWVTKGDPNDLKNGCAGIAGHAITGVQMIYLTPAGETYQQAWYRTQDAMQLGWHGVVCDDGTSVQGYTDDYAGWGTYPVDRLQIVVGIANPY